MKGGAYMLNNWKLPIILFALVCTTIVVGWQNAPFLTSVIPSQSQFFRISSDSSKLSNGSPVPSTSRIQSVRNETSYIHRGHDMPTSGSIESVDRNNKGTSSSTGGKGSGSAEEEKGFPDSVSYPRISVDPVNNKRKWNMRNQVNNKSCNYARGKWVAEDHRPFYSGSGCTQWLSGMWACRLTQRTDFAYEKFRWQPFDCEMEEFEASKFLERMRDKTLAFVGDSLGRQQFQSLMCMLTGGEQRDDVTNVGWEYGLVKARGAVRPDGWAYRFPATNTTILFYWSSCLTDLEPLNQTDPHTEYAMHLDRPPAFLRRFISRFDVLVLNTGHHWNRGKITGNKWIMHTGGAPNNNSNIKDIIGAKNFTVHSITRWVESQLTHHPNMKAFFRSMSPRHFFNGDWNTGGTCDNTSPLSKGKEVLRNESSDLVSAMAVKGTKVKLLDITAMSDLRDEGHISRYSIRPTPGMQDCLHWCLPGVPDTWNELLFAQL